MDLWKDSIVSSNRLSGVQEGIAILIILSRWFTYDVDFSNLTYPHEIAKRPILIIQNLTNQNIVIFAGKALKMRILSRLKNVRCLIFLHPRILRSQSIKYIPYFVIIAGKNPQVNFLKMFLNLSNMAQESEHMWVISLITSWFHMNEHLNCAQISSDFLSVREL